MGVFHVINVVHTEHDWWHSPVAGALESSCEANIYGGLDVGVARLLERFDEMHTRTGARIPITWCLWFSNDIVDDQGRSIPDIVDTRRDFFQARMTLGDEIGIHPHARERSEQWRYIRENAAKLSDADFPYPSTHVGGWFVTDENVIAELNSCDIRIDAGPVVRPGDGSVHGRPPDSHLSYRPYHPSITNPWQAGVSSIVRVPLFLSYHGIWNGAEEFLGYAKHQYERRHEVPVEIVHFYWHPCEMVERDSGEPNDAVVDGYSDLLSEIGTWPDVVFSTARDAVTDWRRAESEPVKADSV